MGYKLIISRGHLGKPSFGIKEWNVHLSIFAINSDGCIHAHPEDLKTIDKILEELGVNVRPNPLGKLPYPYQPQGLLSVEEIGPELPPSTKEQYYNSNIDKEHVILLWTIFYNTNAIWHKNQLKLYSNKLVNNRHITWLHYDWITINYMWLQHFVQFIKEFKILCTLGNRLILKSGHSFCKTTSVWNMKLLKFVGTVSVILFSSHWSSSKY